MNKKKVKAAVKKVIKEHIEVMLRLRISELEDEVKEWKEKCIEAKASGCREESLK